MGISSYPIELFDPGCIPVGFVEPASSNICRWPMVRFDRLYVHHAASHVVCGITNKKKFMYFIQIDDISILKGCPLKLEDKFA